MTTADWRNVRIEVAPVKSSGAEFISTLVGLQKTLGTIDMRDAAIEDLRAELSAERERAERAEARSRELETRLQAVREVVR